MQKNRKLLYPLLVLCFFLLLGGIYLGRRSVGGPVLHTQHAAEAQTAPVRGEQSAAASQTPTQTERRINLNTATLEELTSLPGIGEVRGRQILDYRAEHGPFRSIADLMNVNGIGEGIYAKLRDLIYVEGTDENSDY